MRKKGQVELFEDGLRSVTSAVFELVGVVVGRNILGRHGLITKAVPERNTDPVATHDVVDVIAKARSTRSDASTETEFVVRDEAGPFVILETRTEAVAVDETANCERKKSISSKG